MNKLFKNFLFIVALLMAGLTGVQGQITIPANSYLIDMGVNSAVKPAGLRAYGMIHELVKFYKIPVLWVVRKGKTKDAVDYTIGGNSYKGGIFIITEKYVTGPVASALAGWTTGSPASPNGYTRGLVVARKTTAAYTFSGANIDTIKTAPTWTLDAQNGLIAVGFFTNAGIPAAAYNWLAPSQLASCSDIFVMPHADPTWATHGNLYNWNLQHKGAIWLSCHAVSALENMYNPANTSQQTNFLSTKATSAGTGIILPVTNSTAYAQNSLVLWANHSHASVPYTTNDVIPAPQTGTSAAPDDWVSQFIGVTNLAHLNGSEQVYLPVLGQSWRPTTKIITFDAQQANVPTNSPGAAVVLAYGHAFGDLQRGQVMMNGGHSINKGTAGDVPAQSAFFNWSYLAVKDKAVSVGAMSGLPVSGDIFASIPLSVAAVSPIAGYTSANLTYTWSCIRKSDGASVGSFTPNGSSSAVNTTFNPGTPVSVTDVIISVAVSDPCGRSTTDFFTGRVLPAAGAPILANDNGGISGSCYSSGTSVTVDVLANDSDPDGNLNSTSVQLVNPANPAQKGSSYTVVDQGTWTTNGTTVTFTPVSNFFGGASITYSACDNSPTPQCGTAIVSVSVGSANTQGCFPGSTWGVDSSLASISALPAAVSVTNAANASGAPDYDALDNTTYAVMNANTDFLYLDFGSVITTDTYDSVVVYFATGTDLSSVTASVAASTTSAGTYTTLGTLATTDNDIPGEARFKIPVGGFRYLRINRSAGTPELWVDAAEVEKYDCISAQLNAVNDVVSVSEDNPITIGVLDNDDNPGDLGLNITITQLPTNGKLSINSNNTITYINNKDVSGSDVFKYKICNSLGFCDTATVNITVVDDACATGQYKAVLTGTAVVTTLTSPFADTYLRENTADSLKNYGGSAELRVKGKQDGTRERTLIKFTLPAAIKGTNVIIDSASLSLYLSKNAGKENVAVYRATKGWNAGTNNGTVGGNGPSWTRQQNATSTIYWSKPGGDFDSTVKHASTNVGSSVNKYIDWNVKSLLQLYANGTPDSGMMILRDPETKTATVKEMKFHSSDKSGGSAPKLYIRYFTVSSTCAAIPNRAPLANPDNASTTTGTAVTISNAMVNDGDVDTSPTLSITAASRLTASKGAISITGNNITYTPNSSSAVPRVDTLLYTLSDGALTDQAYIYVSVGNAAPVISRDNSTGNSGASQTIALGGNDSDPEGGALNNAVVTVEPQSGSFTISGNSIIYTPNAGFYGNDTLIYRRAETVANGCDAEGLGDTALVVITVTNQAPSAANKAATAYSCQSVNIDLLNKISDPENQKLTINITSGSTVGGVTTLTNGTLTKVEDGIYTFKANNVITSQAINYTVTDPGGLTSTTGVITVTISDPNNNQAPVANDDVYDNDTKDGVTLLNQDLYVDVLSNDTEPDQNFFGLQLTAYPSGPTLLKAKHGTVSVFGTQLLYVPTFNYSGLDTFDYVVYDSVAPGGCGSFGRKYDIGRAFVKVNKLDSLTPARISGTLWNDKDGSAASSFANIFTSGEVGINPDNSVYIYLIDSLEKVIDKATFNPDGTFTMAGAPPYYPRLKAVVTTKVAQIGDPKPITTLAPQMELWDMGVGDLPNGWVNTTPLEVPIISTDGLYVTGIDFGVDQLPLTDDKVENLTDVAVNADYPLSAVLFAGSDAEDSPVAGSINSGGRFVITELPPSTDATLYYNGLAITVPDTISNYNPALLSIRFKLNTVLVTTFKYATVDSAGWADQSPATYTVNAIFVLPVTGFTLAGEKLGSDVKLGWSTLTERKTRQFEIERSYDGSNFSAIGAVKATGSSNSKQQYGYTDKGVTAATVYYRVRLLDEDGKATFSNVAVVKGKNLGSGIRVYPNPVSRSAYVEIAEVGRYRIQLFNSARQLVQSAEFTLTQPGQLFKLDRNNLAKGIYTVHVLNTTTNKAQQQQILLSE